MAPVGWLRVNSALVTHLTQGTSNSQVPHPWEDAESKRCTANSQAPPGFFGKRWMGKELEHLTNLKQGHCWGRSEGNIWFGAGRVFGHHLLASSFSRKIPSLMGLLSPWNHYFWWRICLVDFVDKNFSHWLGFSTKIQLKFSFSWQNVYSQVSLLI